MHALQAHPSTSRAPHGLPRPFNGLCQEGSAAHRCLEPLQHELDCQGKIGEERAKEVLQQGGDPVYQCLQY